MGERTTLKMTQCLFEITTASITKSHSGCLPTKKPEVGGFLEELPFFLESLGEFIVDTAGDLSSFMTSRSFWLRGQR